MSLYPLSFLIISESIGSLQEVWWKQKAKQEMDITNISRKKNTVAMSELVVHIRESIQEITIEYFHCKTQFRTK